MSTPHAPDRAERLLQCVGTGLSVGAVVYHQSMTHLIARDLDVPASSMWLLSVATQCGYGLGLVLGLPLGDVLPARKMIPGLVLALGIALLLQSMAGHVAVLVALCLLCGVLSIGGQLLIAHAARTVPPAQRQPMIGALLSALFTGLLLSRLLGGWLAEHVGWRAVYGGLGMATLFVGLALSRTIRDSDAPTGTQRPPYKALLTSQWLLWRHTPELRRIAFAAAAFFAALNALWANLPSFLHDAMGWQSREIGWLALTAVIGLRAPAIADKARQLAGWVGSMSMGCALLGGMSVCACIAGPSPLLIALWLLVTDLCVRSAHVLCQSRILALSPPAASRLNSLFMTVYFIGAALGSWLGGLATEHLGWHGLGLIPVLCVIATVPFI